MRQIVTPQSFDALVRSARRQLSPRRFLHSMGFCHTATALASRWGANIGAAAVVGILHDLAKEEPSHDLRADLQRRGHPIHPEDEDFHRVWHAQAAAVWAEQEHGIRDPAILEAIRLHPTADAGVALLTRIAFVSDMIEPTRHWHGVQEVRKLAHRDFDAAFLSTVKAKIAHLLEANKVVHPRALRALSAFQPVQEKFIQEEAYGHR